MELLGKFQVSASGITGPHAIGNLADVAVGRLGGHVDMSRGVNGAEAQLSFNESTPLITAIVRLAVLEALGQNKTVDQVMEDVSRSLSSSQFPSSAIPGGGQS
jgi:hypothetical protein